MESLQRYVFSAIGVMVVVMPDELDELEGQEVLDYKDSLGLLLE